MSNERIRDVLTEWQKGCSCAEPGRPETCPECTRAALDAIADAVGFEIEPSPRDHLRELAPRGDS